MIFVNVDILWAKFLERIKNDVNSMVFKTYFSNTRLLSIEKNKMIISVPNEICQKRLDTSYYDIVNAILLEITNQTYELKFILASTLNIPNPRLLFQLHMVAYNKYCNICSILKVRLQKINHMF